jgi:Flp pilus assembly protein TadD
VLARLGRYPEAETAFRTEIERFPASTAAYTRLAIVFGLQHRTYGDVDRLFEQMVQANPRPEAAEAAARTLETMGDRAGAARWTRRAAALRARVQ